MNLEQRKNGEALFSAAMNLEETCSEIEHLSKTLDLRLTEVFAAQSNTFATIEQTETPAKQPSYNYWAHQYNFDLVRKAPGKKRASASLHFEFRLCWPPEHKIVSIGEVE